MNVFVSTRSKGTDLVAELGCLWLSYAGLSVGLTAALQLPLKRVTASPATEAGSA